MNSSGQHLKSMRELRDYEVSREDPDVRGWTVVGPDGHRVGTVSDLMVDTDRMKVEYLAVAGDESRGEPIMVPVGSAQLDTQNREVVISGAPGTAEAVRGSEPSVGAGDRDRTRLTRAEEELRIGKRDVTVGEVVVGKHVETERVSEPVSVERERVHVERRPVTDDAVRATAIGEDEIRVPVVEEELIVEKRPVVKEEVVISKERVRETETVEADVRREEIDVRGTPDSVLDQDRNRTRGR